MKILHICKLGYQGAGNAASRHNEALCRAGYDSKLLVLEGNPKKDIVLGTKLSTKVLEFLSKVLKHLIGSPKVVYHYMFGNYNIDKLQCVREADIVYIHWINDFIGYKDIDYLLRNKKKVVWFLHDMWPITGGCHYSFDCIKFKDQCKNCPQLRLFKNISYIQQKKKIKAWSKHENFIIASPSVWLADCAKQSAIFKDSKVIVCPNVIDTDVFRPKDKKTCRSRLGLELDKHYLMISAVDANNIYKGFDYLCKGIEMVKTPNTKFIVVGNVNLDNYPQNIKDKIIPLGYIKDREKIIDIYNSADGYVTSSIAENFPNVVIEAMACGTPAVGFATGGITDQIKHKETGYLAKYKDSEDLARGIDWILNCNDYGRLCENARSYVIDNCSYLNVKRNHKQILG